MAWFDSCRDSRKIETLEKYGANYGECWNDGIFTSVRQIIVYHGEAIDAMLVQYDKYGELKWAQLHGEIIGGNIVNIIRFHPDEFLIGVSGTFGDTIRGDAVKSLKFHSNRCSYGPYGDIRGHKFNIQPLRGKIVGFHGKTKVFLNAIGVHVRHDNSMDNREILSAASGGSNEKLITRVHVEGNSSMDPRGIRSDASRCSNDKKEYMFHRRLQAIDCLENLPMNDEEYENAVSYFLFGNVKMADAFLAFPESMRLNWLSTTMKKRRLMKMCKTGLFFLSGGLALIFLICIGVNLGIKNKKN